MIRGTSDRQNFDFHIPRYAQEIGPEVFQAIRGDDRGALLGTEYTMKEVGCVCMAHLLSPLRGLVETDIFPALTRWANEFRPPGFGWNSRRKMEFPD